MKNALFNGPRSIIFSLKRNCFYVSDGQNYLIRKIDKKTEIVSSLCGSGDPGIKKQKNTNTNKQNTKKYIYKRAHTNTKTQTNTHHTRKHKPKHKQTQELEMVLVKMQSLHFPAIWR